MTAHVRPLLGLAPGGVCHAGPVASPAVGSYPTLSPLPFGRSRQAVCFLWHFPSACAGRPLAVALSSWSPDFPPARSYPRASGCPAFWSFPPYIPSNPLAKGLGGETCKKLESPVRADQARRQKREQNKTLLKLPKLILSEVEGERARILLLLLSRRKPGPSAPILLPLRSFPQPALRISKSGQTGKIPLRIKARKEKSENLRYPPTTGVTLRA